MCWIPNRLLPSRIYVSLYLLDTIRYYLILLSGYMYQMTPFNELVILMMMTSSSCRWSLREAVVVWCWSVGHEFLRLRRLCFCSTPSWFTTTPSLSSHLRKKGPKHSNTMHKSKRNIKLVWLKMGSMPFDTQICLGVCKTMIFNLFEHRQDWFWKQHMRIPYIAWLCFFVISQFPKKN